MFQASNASHTDDTDITHIEQNEPTPVPQSSITQLSSTASQLHNEQNSTAGGFREPTPQPAAKKKKVAQLSSMVSQLKEIADTTNSRVEENEFEVNRWIDRMVNTLVFN